MQGRLNSKTGAVPGNHVQAAVGQPSRTRHCRLTRSSSIQWRVRGKQRSIGRPSSASEPITTTSSSSSRHAAVSTAQPEMCVVVDEDNNAIGSATRYETVTKRLLGRGAYVLVFNSAGQLFVSKRSMSKDCYPGCLDVTISGVVNQGEEYADTAARELQEEIGIPAHEVSSRLQQLFTFPYQDDVCHVWGSTFSIVWDGPVNFIDKEVEWGKFINLDELQQQLQDDAQQFTPVGRHILDLYLESAQRPLQNVKSC